MPWMITKHRPEARRSAAVVAAAVLAALLSGCGAGRQQASVAAPAPPGRTQFESYCAACHAIDGQGVESEAPPLAGSSWVSGPEQRLIRILLHGVRGPIEVRGRTYNREMLGFGRVMSDAEIASLASFVRGSFGGVATPVDAAQVSRIRATTSQRTTPWTAEELLEDR